MRFWIFVSWFIGSSTIYAQSKKELILDQEIMISRLERSIDSIYLLIKQENDTVNKLKDLRTLDGHRMDSLEQVRVNMSNRARGLLAAFAKDSVAISQLIKNSHVSNSALQMLGSYIDYTQYLSIYEEEYIGTEYATMITFLETEMDRIAKKAGLEDMTATREALFGYYINHSEEYGRIRALQFVNSDEQESQCLNVICKGIVSQIDEMIENNEWSSTISSKRQELFQYFTRLENLDVQSIYFLDNYLLYDIVRNYKEIGDLESALKYSTIVLENCDKKKIKYYNFSQRCDIYISLNEFHLALKDCNSSIVYLKKEKDKQYSVFLKELKKCNILMALGKFSESYGILNRLFFSLTAEERSNKFMSDKKSWILSKQVICLYELGNTSKADDLFNLLREYYYCDYLVLEIGDLEFDLCHYYDTHY